VERRSRSKEVVWRRRQVDVCDRMASHVCSSVRRTIQLGVERNLLVVRVEAWEQLWELHYVE
jgi:hypothetical protein